MEINYLKNTLKSIGNPVTTSFIARHEDDIFLIKQMLREKIHEINEDPTNYL